jgi:ADP-ribose pyrophosphatase
VSGVPDDPPPFPPFARESSTRIYDSAWCGLRRDRVRLPDGTPLDYHVFEVSEAVCVVPELDDGSIVLVWQYRYPHGRTHWEVPAGRVQPGEAPRAAAERELLEETGYRCARLEALAGFYPVNGISPHYAHVFVARGCVRAQATSHDPSERMSVHVFPAAEVHERLLRGVYQDGFTALALHQHFARRAPTADPAAR